MTNPLSKMPRCSKIKGLALILGGLGLCLGLWVSLQEAITSTARFHESRAFSHLVRQCSFGPRVPGTEAHRACLEYLTQELERLLPGVRHHRFLHRSAALGAKLEGVNIWARTNGLPNPAVPQMLLCAHWDSRPMADRDPVRTNRSKGVPGANDGASGVAVLLEVARVLSQSPPPLEVHIVLFDMEDMGGLPPNSPIADPFCIGSERFATDHPWFRPDFGILLDMVGKRGLKIRKEAFSRQRAPQVLDRIWAVARRLGSGAFLDEPGPAVYDDHVPFLERGIPVVDLVDMDYAAWHTIQDTPEQCSPESLRQVGEVVLGLIYGR